ncbi:hypothetical protein Gotri_014140, partial [Gossypium trilobum]|nr:hypothetical protein [Gossypium trilobum]
GVTNRLRWYLESPCEYTVQSGYKILLKGFPRTEEDSYSFIDQETRICLRCGEDSETNIHASRDCLLALQVWQELGINWRVNQTKDCMANWVRQLFFGSGNQKKLIVIIAIWAIWLLRNKLVHEGKQQSKTETVTFILGYVHELELLTGKRVEQAAEETVVWRSPSNPFVRANFEAIFYKEHWLVPRLLDSQELGFWAMVVEGNSLVWVEDGLTVIQRLVEEKGQFTLQ